MKKGILNFFVLLCPLLFSCSGGGTTSSKYDGNVFDISAAGDNSLTARTEKVKPEGKDYYDYHLTISGVGPAKDYEKATKVPWNSLSNLITSVVIEEGITHIGDYFFKSLGMEKLVLPNTVTSVGDNAFNENTKIFTFGAELTNIPNEVYYYSEESPTDKEKNYFYTIDGVPYIWQTTSVLFVGNSFTFYPSSTAAPSVPLYFKSIATDLKQGTVIDYVLKGGHSLTKHANPNDECGKVLEEKLTTKQYDYVILQEQSTTPLNSNGYKSFVNAIKTIRKRVMETQENCEVILYQTWGSPSVYADNGFASVGKMEEALRTAYKNAGNETDCKVHYVGKAFTTAYETHEIDIYHSDRRHQNELGSYLSAAVHIKSLFNMDVTKTTNYCGLDETTCKKLLEIANEN